jgi:hypothetical protein
VNQATGDTNIQGNFIVRGGKSGGLHIDQVLGTTFVKDHLMIGSDSSSHKGARATTVRSTDDVALVKIESGQSNNSHMLLQAPVGKDGILSLGHDPDILLRQFRRKDQQFSNIDGATTRDMPQPSSIGYEGAHDGEVQSKSNVGKKGYSLVHRSSGTSNLLAIDDGEYDLITMGTGNTSIKGVLSMHESLSVETDLVVGGRHHMVNCDPLKVKGNVAMSIVSYDSSASMDILSTDASDMAKAQGHPTSTFLSYNKTVSANIMVKAPSSLSTVIRIQQFDFVHSSTLQSIHNAEPLDGIRKTPISTRALSIEYKSDELVRISPSYALPNYVGEFLERFIGCCIYFHR